MIRSIVIAVFLPLALIASSISSFASASEPSDIGFVLYTRSDSPGTLNARWIYGEQYRGPGIATGGPRDGFWPAALNAFAKKLAVVEGAHGIRTNALLPGSTEFPGGGWETMREHQPEIYEMVRQSVPSGRRWSWTGVSPRRFADRGQSVGALSTKLLMRTIIPYSVTRW